MRREQPIVHSTDPACKSTADTAAHAPRPRFGG
jgi:hypothetical protein